MKKRNISNSRPKPIPPFKTLDEEADYWDTHDVSKLFDNPNTLLSTLPLLEKEKEKTLIVRLQTSLKTKLMSLKEKLSKEVFVQIYQTFFQLEVTAVLALAVGQAETYRPSMAEIRVHTGNKG